jgi:hypothetical protein
MQVQPEEFMSGTIEIRPIDLLKNELAADVVRSSGTLALRVCGTSMLPAIRPGDMLTVRHCAIDDVCVGDVVLALRERRLIAHRVVSHLGQLLLTRGDAISEPDTPVSEAELLGKVSRVLRGGKSVAAKSSFSGRVAARLFRRSRTARRLFTRLQSLRARGRL